LQQANVMVGRRDVEIQADDVEDAAMYMADFLRSVAGAPLSGLLLEDGELSPVVDDVDRCRPIMNVAAHYRWGIVWRTSGDAPVAAAISTVVDGIILAGIPPASAKAVGVDVGSAVWRGGEVPSLSDGQFYYAEIAVGETPEQVLDGLARLRG
jgi:hypothetical protein